MSPSATGPTTDWLPSSGQNACAHIFSLSTVGVYIDEGHPKDILLRAAWESRSLYYCTASFAVEASSVSPKKTHNSINALNLVYPPHRLPRLARFSRMQYPLNQTYLQGRASLTCNFIPRFAVASNGRPSVTEAALRAHPCQDRKCIPSVYYFDSITL